MIDIVLVVIDSADETDICQTWMPPDTSSSSASPTGTSLDCCEIKTRLYKCMHSPAEVPRWSGCCCAATRLRTQPEERGLYERTRRDLAARRWDYIQDYADAKASEVEEIISRAQAGQTR